MDVRYGVVMATVWKLDEPWPPLSSSYIQRQVQQAGARRTSAREQADVGTERALAFSWGVVTCVWPPFSVSC